MITPTRERRDWTLLVFIIPIGIILMLIAGQVAIRLVPEWSVNAGMQSKLDPNNLPMQQNGPVQPIMPAILTPLGWLDTFLTPGADSEDNTFPPFVIFEPSATPVVTDPPPTVVTTQPPPTVPTADTPIVTASPPPVTPTKKPTDEPTSTPPTSTPPTSTPPTLPPVISTLPATATQVPAPTDIVGPPNLSVLTLQDGQYTVIDLGSTPITVEGTSDTAYEMAYYESYNIICLGVCMDEVIIGISNDPDGSSYYMVFNWGDGIADMNSSVGDVAGTETDNQAIPSSELIGPPLLETGIEIDVDNALSNPPLGTYQYVVIFAPETSEADGADINSVEIYPDPPNPAPIQSMDEAPNPPAEEAPSPPQDNADPPAVEAPNPPEENADPPAEDAPEPPSDNEPASPPVEEPPSSP